MPNFDRERPYNHLPLLPPKVELETKAVLKSAIAARTALEKLKGAGQDRLNFLSFFNTSSYIC
jgi:hypothetical protein